MREALFRNGFVCVLGGLWNEKLVVPYKGTDPAHVRLQGMHRTQDIKPLILHGGERRWVKGAESHPVWLSMVDLEIGIEH